MPTGTGIDRFVSGGKIMMKDIPDSLLFRGLSVLQMEQTEQGLAGRVRIMEAGEHYSHPGEILQYAAVMMSGSLLQVQITPDGEYSLFRKFKPGYMVGIDILCTPSGIDAYETYSPAGAALYEFDFARLEHPGYIPDDCREIILKNIRSYLANEVVRSRYRLQMLSTPGLRDRIMVFLQIRRQKAGKNEFEIPYSRQEMADYLCVNRSALSHELSLMQKDGLIRFCKNRFEVIF